MGGCCCKKKGGEAAVGEKEQVAKAREAEATQETTEPAKAAAQPSPKPMGGAKKAAKGAAKSDSSLSWEEAGPGGKKRAKPSRNRSRQIDLSIGDFGTTEAPRYGSSRLSDETAPFTDPTLLSLSDADAVPIAGPRHVADPDAVTLQPAPTLRTNTTLRTITTTNTATKTLPLPLPLSTPNRTLARESEESEGSGYITLH